MKIALFAPISHSLPPEKYAPWEKVVYTLASGLHVRGMDVTVLAAGDSRAPFSIHATRPLSLENLTDPNRADEEEMLHVGESLAHLRDGEYDLIHNHMHWRGLVALEGLSTPSVTTLHGFDSYAKYIFEHLKERNYVSISHGMRALSPHLNYVANVYNGVDFDFFKLHAKKKDYLFCGARIHPDKGIHHGIELAKRLGKKLYLAGIIHDEKYYAEKVKPEIDNNKIVFLGNLSQEEIARYVGEAQAYLSLVDYEEYFGLSVAEAIASGTPVIATARGSMKELVKDGVSGILVQSVDEAVERFSEIENINARECRAYGESLFSIEKMIDGYFAVYEKILAGK